MKSLVYTAPNTLVYKDVERPACKNGEVAIKVKAVGICGSDVHGYMGESGRRIPPMTMGHEVAGQIVEVGEGVSEFKIGDRVAIDPIVPCNECEVCQGGTPNLCPQRRVVGVSTPMGTINGGMADFLVVPTEAVFHIPEDISWDEGALIDPLAVSLHAVKQAGNLNSKKVAVVGCGPIGLFALQCAKSLGAQSVTAFDLSEYRLQVAAQLGASKTINAASPDVNQYSQAFDVVIEAVGIRKTYETAIGMTRGGGTVICLGLNEKTPAINMHEVVSRELILKGTYIFQRKEIPETIDLILQKKVVVEPLISKRMSLADGDKAFAELAKGASDSIKIMMYPENK